MYENLVSLAILAFAFSVVSGRIERSIITGPMIFIAFGLVAGPVGLGFLNIEVKTLELRVIADLTLALVLFIDAANADRVILRSHARIPLRLLLIGLPLCIALGVGVGMVVFPHIALIELCILATMLAPTDAALGKGVVTNKAVPARIRESLNVESGLNDGISVPVLLVFLALATGTGGGTSTGVLALTLVAREIGIGVGVGVIMSLVGGKVISICAQRGWLTDVWKQIPVVSLALACFATAQSLDGSGYIAAFVGGLLFGRLAKEKTHKLVMAGEGIAELLSMLTWVLFGGIVGKYLAGMTLDVVIYSLLSLTLIRMLPVIIALPGLGEKLETKLFLAWFGPRGLASIVFCIIVVNANLPSVSVLTQTVVCTVMLCVLAHGLTANPWAKGIARRLKSE